MTRARNNEADYVPCSLSAGGAIRLVWSGAIRLVWSGDTANGLATAINPVLIRCSMPAGLCPLASATHALPVDTLADQPTALQIAYLRPGYFGLTTPVLVRLAVPDWLSTTPTH